MPSVHQSTKAGPRPSRTTLVFFETVQDKLASFEASGGTVTEQTRGSCDISPNSATSSAALVKLKECTEALKVAVREAVTKAEAQKVANAEYVKPLQALLELLKTVNPETLNEHFRSDNQKALTQLKVEVDKVLPMEASWLQLDQSHESEEPNEASRSSWGAWLWGSKGEDSAHPASVMETARMAELATDGSEVQQSVVLAEASEDAAIGDGSKELEPLMQQSSMQTLAPEDAAIDDMANEDNEEEDDPMMEVQPSSILEMATDKESQAEISKADEELTPDLDTSSIKANDDSEPLTVSGGGVRA